MSGNISPSRIPVPSVSELLESPPIRALTDRWSRSAVAAGLRSFVEELRIDLVRRGEDAGWPSPRELAEMAARHILAAPMTSQRAAINATGQFWGDTWIGRPQGDVALEQGFALGREFVMDASHGHSSSKTHTAGDPESLICRRTGSSAAAVVHSYSAALWLAIAALASGKEVLVARGQVGFVELNCRLDSLIASAGAASREIGAVNLTTHADFAAAITARSAAILSVANEDYQVVGRQIGASRADRVALARDRGLATIEGLGVSSLAIKTDSAVGETSGFDDSVQKALREGLQIAVVRGDGFLGGPSCGILAGDAQLIERITQHPMYRALQLEPPRRAELAASLMELEADTPPISRLPLAELLATPIENLRHRAERLAAQISMVVEIAVAEPMPLHSPITRFDSNAMAMPSYGVSLEPSDGDAPKLAQRLADARPAIIARLHENRVVLDLRTVFPRHDAAIATELLGSQAKPE